MSDDLYQQEIMTLVKSAIRAGKLSNPDSAATVDNPLCGDRVTVELKLDGEVITDLAHKVRGCALCQASASVIGSHAIGLRLADVQGAVKALKEMMTGSGAAPVGAWADLGAFLPVRDHKSRQECVRLPFSALEKALAGAKPKL